MDKDGDKPLFFLVAGEASGDLLGARLMQALKKKTNRQVRFAGVGGSRMRAEGIDLLFSKSELAHMGLFELLRHLPRLLRRMRQVVEAVKEQQPVALITIDSPDFNFRVAKKLKGEGIPLIHYVAPTVWAWRPGRAKKIAQFLDHLLALLPFEPPYFAKHGLGCTFVGHPLVESGADKGDAQRFCRQFELSDDVPILAVLPGSRMGEIKRLLPVFKGAVEKILQTHPDLHLVVPTVRGLACVVQDAMKDWPLPIHFTDNDADKYDGFAAARAALACSGTVSIELAMAGLPSVIAYKVSPLTAALYRHFIKTKYVTLVNIMRKRMVMPEFLQENCTPGKLAEAVTLLLDDEIERQEQIAEFKAASDWLGRGQFVPSEKAAETIWNVAFPAKKKALRVLQIIPRLSIGGAEQACVDIAAALVSRGDRAFVVSSGGRRVREIEEAGGIHITRDVRTKNPFKIIRNAFWLAEVIRCEKIDIVHARSRAPAWSAHLACLMTGCLYVTTFHAAYKFSNRLKRFYNSVMTRSHAVIAISSFIAAHIGEHYNKADGKIHLIDRGVDVEEFNPAIVSEERKAAFRAQAGLGPEEKAILVPGRLSPIKGQDNLIEALGLLKKRGVALPPVLIVGDDQGRQAYTESLKKKIEAFDLSDIVRLTGPSADMPACYAVASLVVVPSKVAEGFGRVPVEAMAAGIPVIASALGAMKDTILDGETGWLAPSEKPEALADLIARALSLTAEERAAMAKAAREHAAAHFDEGLMVSKTLAVYDGLMKESLRPSAFGIRGRK